MKDLQIRQTRDGSCTLWVPELKESYHSFHGAVTESNHVFIDHGIKYVSQDGKPEVSVLEIGFGTGLNALLTCHYSQERRLRVKYSTLEPFPLSWELVSQLGYPVQIPHPQSAFWFRELHITSWGQIEWLNPYFSILKLNETVLEHATVNEFDICYFDAFAPTKQPDIWNLKVLEIVRRGLKPSGVLVTYCAQGQFRRNLKQLAFEVESLPGPPGKKEMTRARRTR